MTHLPTLPSATAAMFSVFHKDPKITGPPLANAVAFDRNGLYHVRGQDSVDKSKLDGNGKGEVKGMREKLEKEASNDGDSKKGNIKK